MKKLNSSLALIALSTLTSANFAVAGPTSFMDFFKDDQLVNPYLQDSSGQFTIEISTSFSTQQAGETAVQTVAAPAFAEVFQSQYVLKNSTPPPSFSQIEARYARDNRHYKNLTLLQRAEALKTHLADQYKVTVPSDTLLATITIEQIKANPGQISAITSQVRSHLSLGQKIQVASHFGRLFAQDYNSDRRGTNNPNGFITLEGLVESLSNSNNGGVCRDISLAQGQLLNQLGVPSENIYTMAYQTPLAQHAVLVVQSPDSDEIIKLNYGKVMVSSKAGSSGLMIEGKHQAAGLEYKFYDVNGKPVQTQSTALGRLLKDVTGSTPVFADSLKPYNVSKVIMNTRWGQAAVFTGELQDSKDKVTGVAFNSIDMSKILGPNVEVGVAFINRNSNAKDFKFDQQGFFVNLRTMRERDFQIGPVVATAQVGAEAQLGTLHTSTRFEGVSKSKTNTEFNSNAFTAINLKYKNHEVGILAVGYMDFQHVAKAQSGGYTLAVNHVQMHAGTSRMIRNDVVATGRAILTVRDVGNTLNFESSVQKQNQSLVVNYQKPLDNIPLFFDGSTEVIRLQGKSTQSLGGKKSRSGQVDIRYDRDQKEAQAEVGLSWKW